MAAIAAWLAGGIGSANAANLIVNPNFNVDTSNWTADAGTNIFHDASQDANSSAASGALSMFPTNGVGTSLSVHQCINVAGGSDFSFGAKVKPNTTGSYGMTCSVFVSPDCLGDPTASASAIIAGPADPNGWVPLHTESPYLLPGTTQSVSCAITMNLAPPLPAKAPQPEGLSSSIWVDDVFFAPGTTPVTLQAFDID
jgi:hypothetical protein